MQSKVTQVRYCLTVFYILVISRTTIEYFSLGPRLWKSQSSYLFIKSNNWYLTGDEILSAIAKNVAMMPLIQ